MARITGELAELARVTARDAQRVLGNARRALRRAQAKAARLVGAGGDDPVAGRRRGRLARAINDLSGLLQATAKKNGQRLSVSLRQASEFGWLSAEAERYAITVSCAGLSPD